MKFLLTHMRLLGVFIVLAVIGLDQWSKAEIVLHSESGAFPMTLLSFFNLVQVQNRGISFGLFAHMQDIVPLMLALCNSAIALVLAIWLARTQEKYAPPAIGFIIGGAVGNIIDRVRLGSVTDFLDFHIGAYHWPAFNIADSAIFIGVVLLLWLSIINKETSSKEPCE